MNHFTLSVIVPVYNEEKNIDSLLKRLLPVLEPYDYELIFIDDGSQDTTASKIKQYCSTDKRIKLIRFSRNFGHQRALSAGYAKATGDCVISMDSDLQDPPEVIPSMVEKWQKGAKIVYGKRMKRDVDSWFKVITARGFYWFINTLSTVPIPKDVGDFRLLDRVVVDFIVHLPEQSRFLRGLVAWSGYPAAYVEYDRGERHAGETHYPFGKMVAFAFEAITTFSTKPLRIASWMGFIGATFGFLGIIYAVLGKIFLPDYWVTGWTALFVAITFIGGVQLITIGIMGEYIDKIYTEIQKRPMYIISEEVNL
ncbi:MAG: glycosyltransferase family 2 protein [Patescibacteria group bacterium]|nr:glycosyltransferase family 2 protein [Patescibacteria group bacterium]